MKDLVNDGVYMHINNGGVSFGVTNDDYLALEIEAGHFGNLTNRMKLYITQDGLRKIGKSFLEAADARDLKVNDYLRLESYGLDKNTGKTKRNEGQQPASDIGQNHNIKAAAGATAEYIDHFTKNISEIPKLFSSEIHGNPEIQI